MGLPALSRHRIDGEGPAPPGDAGVRGSLAPAATPLGEALAACHGAV
jgi:hypothetical protein